MKVRSEIPTAENTTNMDGFGTCEVGTTLENLKAAIGGETGASAKYAAFAQAAKSRATSRSLACSRPRPLPSRSTSASSTTWPRRSTPQPRSPSRPRSRSTRATST